MKKNNSELARAKWGSAALLPLYVPSLPIFPPGILFVIACRALTPCRLCQFDLQIPATELPQAHFWGRWLESLQCTMDSNEKEDILTSELRQWPFPWKVLYAQTMSSQWWVSMSRARRPHFLNFDIKVHGVNLSNLRVSSSPLDSRRLIHKALFSMRTWSACFPQPLSDTLLELSWVDLAHGWFHGRITESAHVGSVPDSALRHWFVLFPDEFPCVCHIWEPLAPRAKEDSCERVERICEFILCNCNLNILYGVVTLTSPGPTS